MRLFHIIVKKTIYIKVIYVYNVAVKIRSHVLSKRKVKKTSLKTQILTNLNKMSTINQDTVKKKICTYANEDCFKMTESN